MLIHFAVNPWRLSATNMAPFDQEFFLVMNLAVGGSQHFPDDAINMMSKPWTNDSPTAAADFWYKKTGIKTFPVSSKNVFQHNFIRFHLYY